MRYVKGRNDLEDMSRSNEGTGLNDVYGKGACMCGRKWAGLERNRIAQNFSNHRLELMG